MFAATVPTGCVCVPVPARRRHRRAWFSSLRFFLLYTSYIIDLNIDHSYRNSQSLRGLEAQGPGAVRTLFERYRKRTV
jgi:hypothetical protein